MISLILLSFQVLFPLYSPISMCRQCLPSKGDNQVPLPFLRRHYPISLVIRLPIRRLASLLYYRLSAILSNREKPVGPPELLCNHCVACLTLDRRWVDQTSQVTKEPIPWMITVGLMGSAKIRMLPPSLHEFSYRFLLIRRCPQPNDRFGIPHHHSLFLFYKNPFLR